MKKLFYILIFLCWNSANGQSFQTSIDSADVWIKKNCGYKALQWAERAYNQQGSQEELYKSLTLLCRANELLGNTQRAIGYTKEKLDLILKSKDKKIRKEYVSSLISLADYYFFIKEISKADSILRVAEPLAKGIEKETVLDLQTEILISKGQWEDVEQRLIYSPELSFRKELNNGDYYPFVEKMEAQLKATDKTSRSYYTKYLYYYPTIRYIASHSLNDTDDIFVKYAVDSVYTTAEPIFRNYFGNNSTEYFTFLLEIADIYEQENKIEQSEKLYKKIYNESQVSPGLYNSITLDALKGFIDIYIEHGNLIQAQKLLEYNLPIIAQCFGTNSVSYALFLTTFLTFDLEAGREEEAYEKLKIIIPIIEKERGKNSKEYAVMVYYNSLVLKNKNDFAGSSELVNEAIAINEKNGIDCNPCFINLLIALADNYQKNGEWANAEATLRKASDFLNRHSEELSKTDYLLSMQVSLADFYLTCIALGVIDKLNYYPTDTVRKDGKTYIVSKKQPAFTEADILSAYENSINYYSKKYGSDHPEVANYKIRKADYYWITRGIKYSSFNFAAGKEYREALSISQKYISKYFPYLSEKEKNELYRKLQNNFNAYYAFGLKEKPFGLYARSSEDLNRYKEEMGSDSIHYKVIKEQARLATTSGSASNSAFTIWDKNASDILNLRLATKGIIFNSSQNIKRRILTSKDSALIRRYESWEKLKYQIASLYTSDDKKTGSFSHKIDSLERLANTIERELSEKSENFRNNTNETSTTWKDIQKELKTGEAAVEMIRYYIPEFGKDSIKYAALIINKYTTDNPTVIILDHGYKMENEHYKYYKNAIRFKIMDKKSYEIFWKEISKSLSGYNKVYFSPDGVYNLINISSLQSSDGKFVLEEQEIRIVSDLKDILKHSSIEGNNKNAVIIGAPDFKGGDNIKSDNQHVPERSVNMNTILRGGIEDLPGTKEETDQITSLLTQNGWSASLYQGTQASESSVKTNTNRTLLHIATHGFFIHDQGLHRTENPLLHSGLLFSGAAKLNSASGEDGILTAYEAMNLNLENTEMVVLSACETGLGEVQNGEGVYGLQRAFRAAGAKNLIMSLWKVNDEATNELMTSFYSEWISSGDKVKAFRNAQLKVKDKYKYPYYWAAFVLISSE